MNCFDIASKVSAGKHDQHSAEVCKTDVKNKSLWARSVQSHKKLSRSANLWIEHETHKRVVLPRDQIIVKCAHWRAQPESIKIWNELTSVHNLYNCGRVLWERRRSSKEKHYVTWRPTFRWPDAVWLIRMPALLMLQNIHLYWTTKSDRWNTNESTSQTTTYKSWQVFSSRLKK